MIDHEGRGDALFLDAEDADARLGGGREPQVVVADRHEVGAGRCRQAGGVVVFQPNPEAANLGGEVRGAVGVVAGDQRLAEEVHAIVDVRTEANDDARLIPLLRRGEGSAMADELRDRIEVVHSAVVQSVLPAVVAGDDARCADAEQLGAQRDFSGFRLRVVDSELSFEHLEVPGQMAEDFRKAALAGLGLSVAPEAELAFLDDLVEQRAGGGGAAGFKAGLVIVGPRGEPSVACGMAEGALVFAHRLVAGEADDHVLVAVLLDLGCEHLVERLALTQQTEALGLRGGVFLPADFHALDRHADGIALRLVAAGEIDQFLHAAFQFGDHFDSHEVALETGDRLVTGEFRDQPSDLRSLFGESEWRLCRHF